MNKYWLHITLGIVIILLLTGITIPKLTVRNLVPVDERLAQCVAYAINETYDNPVERVALFLGKSRIIATDQNNIAVESFTLFRIPLGALHRQPGMTLKITCDQTISPSGSVLSTITVDPALLTRLQANLQDITPYFIDSRSFDGKPLTSQEEKIKNDIIDILVFKEPENREYYSRLWPRAIGKRYVLVAQPSASSYYDILIDSQTGETSFLKNAAGYIIHYLPLERPRPTEGRQAVLYVGYQDLYTYTLDQASFVLVPGSKLSGNEAYHSGRGDFNLLPEETHTDDSIIISVFDSSQIVQNPRAPENGMQTMNEKIREVTLSF